MKRDSGTIEIFGLDNIKQEHRIKEDIGVVFDECNFHDMLTVNDICKMFKGIYQNWDSRLFFYYLERFKLPSNQKVGTFSKGMKMKLSIISAMSHKPKLLILASIGVAVIVPLFWRGIMLPLVYWFGYQSASWLSMIVIIPCFYAIKYFEDGSGTMPARQSLISIVGAGIVGALNYL